MANEKLIDANKYPCRNCGKTYCHQSCKEFIEWLENTVDAVEVVHAQWLYDSGSERHFCSACDMYAIEQLHRDLDGSEYYEGYLTNYCPNCGADMRGGDGNG